MVFISYIVYNLVSKMIYTSSEVALKSEVRAVDGIFLASLGFPLQLCCIKCSPTLTRILVLAYVCYPIVARCVGVWLCSEM